MHLFVPANQSDLAMVKQPEHLIDEVAGLIAEDCVMLLAGCL